MHMIHKNAVMKLTQRIKLKMCKLVCITAKTALDIESCEEGGYYRLFHSLLYLECFYVHMIKDCSYIVLGINNPIDLKLTLNNCFCVKRKSNMV